MVCESLSKGLVVQGKDALPQCTLPKVSCIVILIVFFKSGFYSLVFSKVQGRSLFVRKSLPYWG
jgi:hypothetical protein